MDLKIKGKNAFITGATRGLGLASLKSLANEGVNISFCSRSEEGIQKVEKYLSQSANTYDLEQRIRELAQNKKTNQYYI